MQSLSTCLVAAALLVAAVNAQFMINTPASITQCVPVQFSWSGGQQPYFLAINPGGVTGAAALQQYTGLTGTSFTWSANITAGTSIGLQLTDSTGSIAQSAPITIQSGPSNSCLNGETSAASGGSTTAAGTTSAANSGTSTTAPAASGSTTKAETSGSGSSASGSKTSGSAASASTSASGGNGALSNVASAGAVGLVGALAAALLV